MTINLNKEYITKKKLLKYVSDYEIYSRYILNQEIMVGKNIYSPFRNESNPSFGFFIGDGGEICFHDFTLRLKGDCIKFVEIMFELNHYEALSKIAIDFDMENDWLIKKTGIPKAEGDFVINHSREHALSKTMYKFKLGKIKRNWEFHDMQYWQKYNISLKTLIEYNVEPISYIVVNDKPIKADKHAYVFIERKDGEETYKIYQPFSKDYKWLNSHNDSIWQGWSQLPVSDHGGTLIITKSLKDVMCIKENTGYNAVALQCENVLPKKQVIDELEERFGLCLIFYDNDYDKEENWGQIFSKRLEQETGFIGRCIDSKHEAKDFSDLVEKVGSKKAVEIFEREILMPF